MKEPCVQGATLEERIEANEKISTMRDEENERQLQSLTKIIHKMEQGNISKMKILNNKIDNLKNEMNDKFDQMEEKMISTIDTSISKSFGKLTKYFKWTAIGLGVLIFILALVYGGQYGVVFSQWLVGLFV